MFYQLLAQTTTLTYNGQQVEDPEGVLAGFLAFMATFFLAILVVAIIGIIASWKIFVKAGVEGWKALIPIYNTWTLFEIAGKPGWWSLIGLTGVIPVLGFIGSLAFFVLVVLAMLSLGRSFGKSTTFSVFGLIIFSIVGMLILGFGEDKYIGPDGVPKQGGAQPNPAQGAPTTATPAPASSSSNDTSAPTPPTVS